MATVPKPRLRMLTTREVAGELGVCSKTVSRWIKNGNLRVHRFGRRTIRIAEEDVTLFKAVHRA